MIKVEHVNLEAERMKILLGKFHATWSHTLFLVYKFQKHVKKKSKILIINNALWHIIIEQPHLTDNIIQLPIHLVKIKLVYMDFNKHDYCPHLHSPSTYESHWSNSIIVTPPLNPKSQMIKNETFFWIMIFRFNNDQRPQFASIKLSDKLRGKKEKLYANMIQSPYLNPQKKENLTWKTNRRIPERLARDTVAQFRSGKCSRSHMQIEREKGLANCYWPGACPVQEELFKRKWRDPLSIENVREMKGGLWYKK